MCHRRQLFHQFSDEEVMKTFRMRLQTKQPSLATRLWRIDVTSPVAHGSVFLAGILFPIHSVNSVFNLILYSYNFAATTVRLLVIAARASCVKPPPLILRPSAATKIVGMCGFSIRNICHGHSKTAADYRKPATLNCAIWRECGEDCLFVWMLFQYMDGGLWAAH